MTPADTLLDQLPAADAQRWLEEGLGCRLDANGAPGRYLRARRLFTFAALLGKSSAKYQLGVMNLRGEGCPKDKLRAAMWFKLAIARDEPRAEGNLAMVAEDLTRAEIRYAYQKAADFVRTEAAFYRIRRQQGDDAIVDFCERLMQGTGVDPDPELAVAWLRRGSLLRHPGAQWLVGLACITGVGTLKDPAEGRRLLQLAAERGHAGAQHDLADWLMRSPGAAAHALALQWYEASAKQDYLPAQYRLGMLYKGGEVLSWPGGMPAQRDTGGALTQRRAPHLMRALEWLNKAAQQGHAEAQYEVGQMHAQAIGTRQDFDQALHWYLQAAAQGHAKAQFNLGFLHSHGQGVAQDYAKAYEWYAISKASGYAIAEQQLDYIGKKLSPEAIELAEWRADSFRHQQLATD